MGTPRQDRTRPSKTHFLLLALVTFSVVAAAYFVESRRTSSVTRARHAVESRELDLAFMRELSRGPATGETEGMKRYLIEDSAKDRTSPFADLCRKMETKRGAEKPHRMRSKSWEGFPTTIRYARVPALKACFVMEKVHGPVKAAANPIFVLICVSGSLLGLLFAWIAFFYRRKLLDVALEEETLSIPAAAPVAPDLTSELGKFIAARNARSESFDRNRALREKILLETFESEARRIHGAARLEEKLVESISGATHSPAFFFRYNPAQGVAELSGAGGASFALEARAASERNLSVYAPLARIMATRFGIVKFQAWPMTEARKSNGGPSRLLGVLVVAEPSAGNGLGNDFMGVFLDRASRHYARQNA